MSAALWKSLFEDSREGYRDAAPAGSAAAGQRTRQLVLGLKGAVVFWCLWACIFSVSQGSLSPHHVVAAPAKVSSVSPS